MSCRPHSAKGATPGECGIDLTPVISIIETKDGKKSYDPLPHSQEMIALNKKFGKLHGISSLLNLATFVATIVYGFHLGGRLR